VDRASSVTRAASGVKSSGSCAAEWRWLDKNEAQARLVLLYARPTANVGGTYAMDWEQPYAGLGSYRWTGRNVRAGTCLQTTEATVALRQRYESRTVGQAMRATNRELRARWPIPGQLK